MNQHPKDLTDGAEHLAPANSFTLQHCRDLASDLRVMQEDGTYPVKLGLADPQRIDWLCDSVACLQQKIAALRGVLKRVQKATIARNATLEEWLYVQMHYLPGQQKYDTAKTEHDAAWAEYTEAWNEAAQQLAALDSPNKEGDK